MSERGGRLRLWLVRLVSFSYVVAMLIVVFKTPSDDWHSGFRSPIPPPAVWLLVLTVMYAILMGTLFVYQRWSLAWPLKDTRRRNTPVRASEKNPARLLVLMGLVVVFEMAAGVWLYKSIWSSASSNREHGPWEDYTAPAKAVSFDDLIPKPVPPLAPVYPAMTPPGHDLPGPSTKTFARPNALASTDPEAGASRPAVAAKIRACSWHPTNGQVLKSSIVSGGDNSGHVVEIRNGSGGNAIVKIKDAGTKRTVLSFFVADSATASAGGIPDGTYLIQFAFGADLDQTCANFIVDRATSEFPTPERLTTQTNGTESDTVHLTYTLYAIQSGNVTPQDIDPAVFDAD